MHILIYSKYPDTHASSVAWALREKGATVTLWNQSNFPGQQFISVECEEGQFRWKLSDHWLSALSEDFDVVWYRRPGIPTLPDYLSADDCEMAKQEAAYLLRGVDEIIAPNARWVNHHTADRRAANKVWQLQIAMQYGFNIPPTLISNDPARIRDFVSKQDVAVYKPFYQAFWQNQESTRTLFTTVVNLTHLQDDRPLSACPGIFQRRVEKSFEVRLTIFGEFPIAVKIFDYPDESLAVDYRIAQYKVSHERIEVPSEILDKCLQMMKRLGIEFGCFDFIVSPDGAYHFLEINPTGQFLWVEEVLPNVPMLEYFCHFLSKGLVLPHPTRPVSMQAYKEIAARESQEAGETRQAANNQRIFPLA